MKFNKLLFSIFLTTLTFFSVKDLFLFSAVRSTQNLRNYENNLETLSDKEGSLHQLIEEMQRLTNRSSTGCAPGGALTNIYGITTDDTIVSAVVFSSCNLVAASTQTLAQTLNDGTAGTAINITSKYWGTMGNNINITFTQRTSTTPNLTALQINTTGYAMEVMLTTGSSGHYYSSGTMVCNAINSDLNARELVSCFVVSNGTATLKPISQFKLAGGLGTLMTSRSVGANYFTISSSQTVTTSTAAPIAVTDGVILNIFDRPDGN